MATNSSNSGYQRTGEGFETLSGCPGSGKLTFVTEGLGDDSVDLSSGFAIPLHLVTYTLVTLVSLLIYWPAGPDSTGAGRSGSRGPPPSSACCLPGRTPG